MANKIITLDDRFATGEPTVQLVVTPGRLGMVRETTSLHKIASSRSPALDYIQRVEPEPGKSIVLIIGLGDHETYGANRNGDGFPSEPVPGKIASDEVLTKHFHTYDNAHVFEHHVNNDPRKAIGRVKKAFWNPHMRRVEVLEDFEHAKAPHLLEKIAAGEYPSKSMGCSIKYDVCTKCGNRAKTRKDYCDHLKYEMNKVYADGTKAAALNPSPGFFDSSWVIRPADRTGFMLKKVAYDSPYEIRSPSYELADLVEDLKSKSAALAKAADIEKVVSGSPEASSSGFDGGSLKLLKRYSDEAAPAEASKLPGLSSEGVKITIEYSPDEAIGTSDQLGLPMGLKDLIKFFMGRMSADVREPAPAELDAASKVASLVCDIYAKYPRFYTDVLKVAGLDNGPRVNTKVANAIDSTHDPLNRNLEDSPLYDRRIPSSLTSAQSPNTDTVSFTDPSLRTHYSNMGMARRATEPLAEDAQNSKLLRGSGYLGMGTLLGGAAMGTLLSKGGRSPLRRLAGGALGGAAVASGMKGVHEAARPTRLSDLNTPMLMTNEGQLIPATTEMSYRKEGAWQPEMIYTVLRHKDAAVNQRLDSALCSQTMGKLAALEICDELSPILGPSLNLAKVALLIEQCILQAQASA